MSRRQTDPAYAARDIVKQLRQHDIDLPDDAASAYAALQNISAPADIEQNAVARLIADGAPEQQVLELLSTEQLRPRYAQAVVTARIIAGNRVLSAIRADAPSIHEQLDTIADELITQIEGAAAVGNVPLNALIRAARNDEARLVADIETNVNKMQHLWLLRDSVWDVRKRDVNGIDCSQWRDPRIATAHSHGESVAASMAAAYSGGAELWFPRPSEWLAVAERINSEMQNQARAVRERQRAELGV